MRRQVCVSIREALLEVGKHQPNLVLSSIHEHLRNPNVERPHRVLLLATLNLVLDLRLAQVAEPLGLALVDSCLREMLGGGGEVIPDWHMAASGNLVTLAGRFPDAVVEALLGRCTPGAMPPYFVVKTLGQVLRSLFALLCCPHLLLGVLCASSIDNAAAQGGAGAAVAAPLVHQQGKHAVGVCNCHWPVLRRRHGLRGQQGGGRGVNHLVCVGRVSGL